MASGATDPGSTPGGGTKLLTLALAFVRIGNEGVRDISLRTSEFNKGGKRCILAYVQASKKIKSSLLSSFLPQTKNGKFTSRF